MIRNRLPALFSLISATTFALAIAACGPNLGAGETDAGDDGDADPTRPDAASTGQIGDPCQRATQCDGELVCAPSGVCSDSVPCSGHEDCGDGSHCSDADQCAQSGDTSPCADERNCAPGDTCVGGICACRGEEIEAELVDVNMMILLDRSGSMRNDLSGTHRGTDHPDSRWQIARGALEILLDGFADQLNLGFAMYPEDRLCGAGIVHVPVSPDSNPEEILAAFDALPPPIHPDISGEPDAFTPSGPSLRAMGSHAPLLDPEAKNTILYITDGEENCGPGGGNNPPEPGDSQVAVAGELRELDIATFVVGFSEDISADELNATAEAAGTAREDPDDGLLFYRANDAEALTGALEEIAAEALDCTFELSAVPDVESLDVYADAESLIRDPDHENGWDYDPDTNTISVFGPVCDGLRLGDIEDLTIVQTCDVIVD